MWERFILWIKSDTWKAKTGQSFWMYSVRSIHFWQCRVLGSKYRPPLPVVDSVRWRPNRTCEDFYNMNQNQNHRLNTMLRTGSILSWVSLPVCIRKGILVLDASIKCSFYQVTLRCVAVCCCRVLYNLWRTVAGTQPSKHAPLQNMQIFLWFNLKIYGNINKQYDEMIICGSFQL
jgi:hypothetical protein